MAAISERKRDLLDVVGVAGYLGVGTVMVYRWCREGRLPCLKVGRSWRIRREALEDFLSRVERSSTLVGRLRAYLAVPDTVVTIAETTDLLHQLDAAFFQVGEARGGLLVKFHGGEPGSNEDELRTELRRNGLDVPRLEKQGRLRLVSEEGPGGSGGRTPCGGSSRRGPAAAGPSGPPSTGPWRRAWRGSSRSRRRWPSRPTLTRSSSRRRCWRGSRTAERRRARAAHAGTIWPSEAGLSLSRVTPLSPG